MSHVLQDAHEENKPRLRSVMFIIGAELCAISDLYLLQFQFLDHRICFLSLDTGKISAFPSRQAFLHFKK